MDDAAEENLRLAEEMYRDLSDQDFGFFQLLDPEIEWQTFFGDVHGVDQVVAYLQAANELFDEPSPEAEEFIPAGDTIVVLGTWRARAKAAGTRVEARFAHILQFRDSRLIRFRNYVDSAKIVEALGAASATLDRRP